MAREHISLRFDSNLLARIDAVRGRLSRRAWLEDLAERALPPEFVVPPNAEQQPVPAPILRRAEEVRAVERTVGGVQPWGGGLGMATWYGVWNRKAGFWCFDRCGTVFHFPSRNIALAQCEKQITRMTPMGSNREDYRDIFEVRAFDSEPVE